MLSAAKHDRVVLSVWMTHIMGHPHPYCVVMRPILFPWDSVNHRLPSGPAAMPNGSQPNLCPHLVGRGNTVSLPPAVRRSMRFPKDKVNHRLPSGPVVMPKGPLRATGNSVTRPAVVMRPILSTLNSVNQRLPSGPTVMPSGRLLGEPQVAVRPDRDALRPATGRGNGECGEAARGGDAPDGVPLERGEPQVAVRPGRDELRPVQG